MTSREKMCAHAEALGLELVELPLRGRNKGLYGDGVIAISDNISTSTEARCVIAEEIGHYHKTYGDILDQTKVANQKQELVARQWAYENLVSFNQLINAFNARVTEHELADYLGVSDDFLHAAVKRYHEKYGTCIKVDDYIIYFDPLGVMKIL